MRVIRRRKPKAMRPPVLERPGDREWLALAATLLTVQAGIGLLSGLAQLGLLAVGLPQSPFGLLAGLGWPIATLWLARGVRRARRWPRRLAIAMQVLIVLAAAARFAIGRELAFGLLPLVSLVLLPLLVAVVLFRPESRRAVAANRRPAAPIALPAGTPLERAA